MLLDKDTVGNGLKFLNVSSVVHSSGSGHIVIAAMLVDRMTRGIE